MNKHLTVEDASLSSPFSIEGIIVGGADIYFVIIAVSPDFIYLPAHTLSVEFVKIVISF